MLNGIGQAGGSSSRPPQGMDPNAYAQKYAQENGMSLEQAKVKLKELYGDPQAPQGAQGGNSLQSTSIWNMSGGSNSVTGMQSPDAMLQQYMSEHGVDEATAKTALKEMYGDPKPPGEQGQQVSQSGEQDGRAEFEAKLRSLGISDNAIAQGQSAIEAEAQEKGIKLPDPPKKPEQLAQNQVGGSFNSEC